ncbi:unnamed protein product [Rotaria magnacalcarata]
MGVFDIKDTPIESLENAVNPLVSLLPDIRKHINEPLCLTRRRVKSRLDENFRVQINVDGFNPEIIQTKIEDVNNVVSLVTSNNMLVIEVPIHDSEVERKLVDAQAEASKEVAQFGQYVTRFLTMLTFWPDMVEVSVKDNQLTVQCESSYKDETCKERPFFRKSITLPPGTQVDQLQPQITDSDELKIEAPYVETTQQ